MSVNSQPRPSRSLDALQSANGELPPLPAAQKMLDTPGRRIPPAHSDSAESDIELEIDIEDTIDSGHEGSSAPTSYSPTKGPIPSGSGRSQHERRPSTQRSDASRAPIVVGGFGGGGIAPPITGVFQSAAEDEYQVPVTEQVDLADWAPSNQQPIFTRGVGLPQLPDFLAASVDSPTSLHLGVGQIQTEMSESINNLLSERVFAELMNDSLGRHRFREYLTWTSGDVASFDLYVDLSAFRSMTDKVKNTSVALYDVFNMNVSVQRGALTGALREDVLAALRQGMVVGDSLELPQQHLLHSLYASEFHSFIKHKLTEEASVLLGQPGLPGTGLGDAFCLTNPRLKDHPIVLVSPGFERLTGYPAKLIIGRNCRFLVGSSTSPMSSKRIHDALNRGESINTLILNYRRSGVPFWNLLCIVPLKDSEGRVTYFLGGQTEVTGSLALGKNLSWLVGSENDPSPPLNPAEEFSPSLRAYASALAMGSRPAENLASTLEPKKFHAHPANVDIAAGGQATVTRQNKYEGAPVKQKGFKGWLNAAMGGGGGTMKRKEKEGSAGVRSRDTGESQQIGGAEALFDKTAKPVEMHIAQFSMVYSKVVVFRRRTREILFVTKDFLENVGVPAAHPTQVYQSPLLHVDILSLLVAPERGDYKKMRRGLKDAIVAGRSFSVEVGIKARRRSQYEADVRYGSLHLSPLMDRDGTVEAFVAIFG